MVSKEPSRYYFAFRVGSINRLWGLILLAGSLAAMAILRSPLALVIFGISALIGAYGIVRPARPGFFVELDVDHLIINVLAPVKIPYDDIASADFYRHKEGEFVRALQNFAIALSRPFGGQFPYVGKPGEVDSRVVELKFKGWKWLHFVFPPLRLPRRSWLLAIGDDALSLRSDLLERLSQRRPDRQGADSAQG